jgi:Uma2 family endonuclease
MNIVLHEPWSVERFLSWEDGHEGKHEFDGTRIVEMTGGSRAHQRIIFNIMRLLSERLDPAVFDAVQEMRVEVGGRVRYPDITVCAGRIPDGVRTLRDAVVTFEVLSDDTADIDRDEKRIEYARLPSMRHYVMLEQRSMVVTMLELLAGGWSETRVSAGTIALPEIAVDLPLDDVYRGVRFPPVAAA